MTDNKTGGSAAHSKSDVRYWKSRLFKRTTDDWQAQIAFAGRRERFPLGTPNRDAAAAKARDISLSLQRDGWDKTVATFKPWTVKQVTASEFPTVGEFLAEVKAVSDLKPRTFEIYARKFRRLVAGIAGIKSTVKKFGLSEEAAQWRQQIETVRLIALTPDAVQSWKVAYLKAAAANPLKHKRAHSTVASLIRAGKALFAPGVRQHLKLRMPTPLPFEGVKTPNTGSHRYKSEINPELLLKQAMRELGGEPEILKIVLLALCVGLRRDEIDTLTWKQIDWNRGVIRVETTDHTATKTDCSEQEVDIDQELVALFKKHLKASQSEFVISSPVLPRPDAVTYHHYRAHRLFKRTNEWLRSKGISSRNPLHALRKEFGSYICAKLGIFAASQALRHRNINLTRDYYVDKKERIALPFGELLDRAEIDERHAEAV